MVVNNGLSFVDYSHLLEVAPRQNTLVTNLNLFEQKFNQSDIAEIVKVTNVRGAIGARARGGERNFLTSEDAVIKLFKIPFYPLDSGVTAQDIQNFVKYAEPNAPKEVEDAVMRKVSMIQASHQEQRERLMVEAVMGFGRTVADASLSYFTEFGVTQTTVPVALGSSSVDPISTLETGGRKVIIDKAGNGAQGYEIVVLCGSTWFQNLISNAFVRTAYQYYASTQEPLRQRLAGNANNRVFVHGGYTFVEDISGYVPAAEAYMFPKGIEGMFTLQYAPADTPALANTIAREAYLFRRDDPRRITIETESSVLAVNARPELSIKLTSV